MNIKPLTYTLHAGNRDTPLPLSSVFNALGLATEKTGDSLVKQAPALAGKALKRFVRQHKIEQRTLQSYREYMANWKAAHPKEFTADPVINALNFNVKEGEIFFQDNEKFRPPHNRQIVSTLLLRMGNEPKIEYISVFSAHDGSDVDDYLRFL